MRASSIDAFRPRNKDVYAVASSDNAKICAGGSRIGSHFCNAPVRLDASSRFGSFAEPGPAKNLRPESCP